MAENSPFRLGAHWLTGAFLSALAGLLPFLGRPPFDFLFWLAAAGLVLNLALFVRHRRRLARLAAWRAADPDHFLLDLTCHLDWDRLSEGLDEEAARPLRALLRSPSRDLRDLKPLLKKALAGLRKNLRRRPGLAGARGYEAFCLALQGQVVGREASPENLGDFPENRWGALSRQAYARAAALAGEEASLFADWGRHLEVRALSFAARGGPEAEDEAREARLAALERYERAVSLDPEFYPAWRGLGRLLNREALTLADQPEKARPLLVRAVDAYETARRAGALDGVFHHEFGQVVFGLAQLSDQQGEHYCRYAARLFNLAAEEAGGDQASRRLAGLALAQAAALNEERRPEEARELYREALDFLERAAREDPAGADSPREAARCLYALFQLAPEPERAEGRGEAFGFLEKAAGWAARAAEIEPGEYAFADLANLLSALAEYGAPEKAGRRWAEAARQYGRAARCADSPADRASVNWHNWGYALAALAEAAPAPRRRRLLKLAARKYERAAALNDADSITLENWGDALGDLALWADNPAEAARFRELAAAKFGEAVRRHPDEAGPWRHWSTLDQAFAREEKNPARRRELWLAALQKLEHGVRANSEDALTWVYWGRLLMDLFGEGPEYERPLLVAGAVEKFEKALSIDRSDAETWIWLGRARLAAADLPGEFHFNGGPLNNAVLAGEHFRTACDLSPSTPGYWADWGQALFMISQIVDNEASGLAALQEAYEKYLTAVSLNPSDGEHHTGLGHILYQWGCRVEDAADKEDRFRKAYEHCGEAGRLTPHDPMVWRNWAKVTEALASLEDDPHKSSAWQSEADEKYYQADALEDPGLRARRH